MNGQHLRALPSEELTKVIGERWKSTGVLTESEGTFIEVRLFRLKYFNCLNYYNFKFPVIAFLLSLLEAR